MTEQVDDINKRIRNCVVNIISLHNKEENKFESLRQDVTKYLTNYENDYKEFTEHINTLNTNYNNVKISCDQMHKTLTEKISEHSRNQSELNDLEAKFNLLRKQLENLELACNKTKKNSELSTVDGTILDLSRKKLDLYTRMTNVVWDYSVPLKSKNVIGYVRNKENNYLHAFEYKKNAMLNNLWNEIEQGSKEVWADIIAMTDLKITK